MTPEDIEFVREQWKWAMINFLVESPNAKANTKRLLTLLVEAEAEKDRIQWMKDHGDWCLRCIDEAKHDWGDSHYQKAVRERWGLE